MANKAGITLDDFLEKIEAGYKWCYACKEWHEIERFGSDSSRYDGLTSLCLNSRKNRNKKNYKPIPPELRKPMGPKPYASRDGDKRQARQRVNVLVRIGDIDHPNAIPCVDCGHIWHPGERRHEYDHWLGYAIKNQYDIESVCTKCHAQREILRKTNYVNRKRDGRGRYSKR